MPEREDFFNGFDDDILKDEDFQEEETTEEETTETEDDDKSEAEEVENEEEESKAEEETDGQVKDQEETDAERLARERHERNERQKALRLKREQEERESKIRDEAKLEAELESTKTNTYTDEPIKDAYDLEVYKLMRKIEDEGGDPVNDLPKRLSQMRREEQAEKTRAEETAKAEKDKILEEMNSFHRRNKNVPSMEKLMEMGFGDKVDTYDPDSSYAERVYTFLNEVDTAKKQGDEKKKEVKKGVKSMTKVPSPRSNGGSPSGETDYLGMSDKEYIEHESRNVQDFF